MRCAAALSVCGGPGETVPLSLPVIHTHSHSTRSTQGDCGSCYAIAAVDMASVRLRIASGNRVKAPLSPQDAMDCSPFTQGCRGGFPFSVGKVRGTGAVGMATSDRTRPFPPRTQALREGGVRTEHCSAYTGRDGICPATGECPSLQPAVDDATADAARPSRSERAMHAAAASAAAVLVQTAARVGPAVGPAATGPAPERAAGSGYATHQRLWSQGAPQPGPADRVEFGDYRYIGGFYGACSEPEMRAELFHKGPIAVTIFVSGPVTFPPHSISSLTPPLCPQRCPCLPEPRLAALLPPRCVHAQRRRLHAGPGPGQGPAHACGHAAGGRSAHAGGRGARRGQAGQRDQGGGRCP